MEPRKRLYETTFIVNASLEDTQIEGAITHIQEVITRNGGEITAVNRWGRKRLAYTIQKKNNGFYANLEFLGTEPVIAQLQRTFQLDQNFLRYLTIQIDKLSLKARALAPPPPPAAVAPPPPPPPAAPAPAAAAPAAQPAAAEAAPAAPSEPEKKPLFDDEPGEKSSPKAS
ncbi:MAG TPA: 30S ribosomal protein S6 [Bacteroidota bacterium]|jgi:small subunit ribosomal protein S6